ncbi:hypothetical protein P152DRAFT_187970 [Eremomyces bilateralis CBS 781.70]|uniref:ER-bound oxygenase mpaB/mpaB'/Rubber oxygenase catalytic domain-containing protein n=1 Tax=Eremomyces bilateralis CBS 781.70 TaxID=1392243 RepID=A0A6G1GC73_9PEZI|nr:uncharacterized protein P152DRAFT_187970 [Eremomyces bilateralis CBS 781.70]KAF1815526.1 hypothetical protein P152DRAFT_187970 [Eremomyces bilateralis CBS 781.70]
MLSELVAAKLTWLAVVTGKAVLWIAVIYPSLFLVGPIIAASVMRISYLVRGIPPGGTPLAGKKEITSFISEDDAAEMKRRNIDPDLPILKRIAAESVTYTGGLPAVLLQIAQEGVGKGVGRHSNFSTRLLERTQNTAIFIYVMVFGNNTERQMFRTFVTMAHKKINDKRTKNTYDAMDPRLQLWVAATMYATMLDSYEKVFGRLPEHEQEQAFQEFSIFGTSLQVPLTMWPQDRAAFQAYWDDMVANLHVPAEAYKTTRDLFQPKYSKLPLGLAVLLAFTRPLTLAVATEELPPHVAVQFGLTSSWRTKLLHGALQGFHKLTFPYYPAFVRQWQKNYYLWMMRERMTKKGMTRNGRHISTELLGA